MTFTRVFVQNLRHTERYLPRDELGLPPRRLVVEQNAAARMQFGQIRTILTGDTRDQLK
jgi:hypothetical protein